MKILRRTLLVWGCWLLAVPLLAADDLPVPQSAAELLPATSMAYVELAAPPKLLSTLLDHPLAKELEKHPDYQQALESPDMQKIRDLVAGLEAKLGQKWRPAISTLTGDGIYASFDLATQGVVVLAKSQDAKLLTAARDAVLDLARAEAKEAGQEDPVTTDDYRGVTAYKVNNVYYVTHGPWLIITNKSMLRRMVLDNAFEPGVGALAGDTRFQTALKTKEGKLTLWAYANLAVLRATGIAKAVFDKKSDNPAVELLVGGVLGAIPDARYVTASVDVQTNRIAVTTLVPYDPAKTKQQREYYFGPQGTGAAPALLKPADTIFSLSTYRDLSGLWKHAPELFDDNINAQFDAAESNLATIFGGKSFSEDILANLQPGLQLVVARQRFTKDDIVPQVKLPAVATVLRMKKPAETARQFKITYQSLIGFLNIIGGQSKLEPLEQNTEKIGGVTLVSAVYLPPEQDEKKQDAAIHFNASPTVAFVGDNFILASTKNLALELAQQIERQAPGESAGINTQVKLDGAVLREALADNRQQLVAQNMLDKGHDKAAAETEVDLVLRIVKAIRGTSLELTNRDHTLRLSWELTLNP